MTTSAAHSLAVSVACVVHHGYVLVLRPFYALLRYDLVALLILPNQIPDLQKSYNHTLLCIYQVLQCKFLYPSEKNDPAVTCT